VVCRSSERKKPVEWQADTFAAHLLMPRRLVYAEWSRFREGNDRPVVIADLRTNHLRETVRFRHWPAPRFLCQGV
jgi:Zn-dependent peptidase ImmA (M78 family)